jgi:hypothetical protein
MTVTKFFEIMSRIFKQVPGPSVGVTPQNKILVVSLSNDIIEWNATDKSVSLAEFIAKKYSTTFVDYPTRYGLLQLANDEVGIVGHLLDYDLLSFEGFTVKA